MLLREMGYSLLRSPATNGTLLATRLPTVYTEEGPVLDPEPVESVNGGQLWSEVRAARYAELEVPGTSGATLAVYATHLHHKDIERRREEDVAGVRRREAEVLFEHFRSRLGERTAAPAAAPEGTSPGAPSAGTSSVAAALVLADWNQPRSCDYEEEDWHVVVTGLAHPAVAQPGDDGVADFMVNSGFRSTFDFPDAARNFGDGRDAPAFTHWTGTTIDFAYLHKVQNNAAAQVEVEGVYVQYTGLSDHLPVVTDLRVGSAGGRK
mmetsp:Transcript_60177/g.196597  ORF Transcript_60177/g.196597 Transcript_60177/m.196597 type:complete len:265 (-) Transcript_60177:192-986(-)